MVTKVKSGKKVELEAKLEKSNSLKRKVEKLELDLEESEEEDDEDNIAKHIFRYLYLFILQHSTAPLYFG